MQSDWNLPTAPVQLTTKVESSPADLRQTPDWQGHFRHIAKARKQLFALFPPAHTAHAFASGIG